MGGTSLPLRFAFALSLSFTAYQPSSTSRFRIPGTFVPSSSSPPKPRVSVSDLLSLLGTKRQASTLDPEAASELRSCLKFLAPFPQGGAPSRWLSSRKTRREDDELVLWPPESVLELARLAFDSGGDPGVIHLTLDPAVIPVPDVEGSNKNKCQLTRTPYGRSFINEEINLYLKFLFELIASRGTEVGLHVSLNRFDLFHGHLFLTRDSRRLGILFHAKEYPEYGKQAFPFNLGYCQIGSTVPYDDSMNLRNILWLAPLPSNSTNTWLTPGVLVVLDANPHGIIYGDLIPEYAKYARTVYEDDFGDVAVDVNYLNVGGAAPDYQIFIC